MADRVYCYPDSDVLMNKLNIRSLERLHEAERKLTMLRLNDLLEVPMTGDIHYFLFQDLYAWAGKVRTVDIAKTNLFCKVQFIYAQAEAIFGKLAKEQYLSELPEDIFIKKLAFYFSEINALHPFREGNGRTQREFDI